MIPHPITKARPRANPAVFFKKIHASMKNIIATQDAVAKFHTLFQCQNP
jgi:hypothetical protein